MIDRLASLLSAYSMKARSFAETYPSVEARSTTAATVDAQLLGWMRSSLDEELAASFPEVRTPVTASGILEATKEVPRIMMSKRRTVGIRVPDNPICLALVEELMHPIISTSANINNESPISDAIEINEQLGKVLDFVIDGGPLPNVPSTVIDLTGDTPYVIREGKGAIDWLAA